MEVGEGQDLIMVVIGWIVVQVSGLILALALVRALVMALESTLKMAREVGLARLGHGVVLDQAVLASL